jgi:dTDP-4-amino-4,6-dideoxygalactose transaminase
MRSDRPALAGGTPVRSELLAFGRPEVGPEEEKAVVEVLRSGWLATGPRTREFERAFAQETGSAHAIATNSWTAGMHLLLRAFGIGPGDEVVIPAITFPATLNVVLHAGARPVLADVLPQQLTLDPEAARAVLGARTRAIVPVHLYGWPCEMDDILALAAERDLVVLEDAAHAIGTRYRGRRAGSLAHAASFSLYVTKNITTAEGGVITTDRGDLVERMRTERLHGIDVDASQRAGSDYVHWEAVSIGWKYGLSDLQAALGLAQLTKLPRFLARRRALDARYRRLLSEVPAFVPVTGPADAETGAHLFPVLIEPGALRIDRDEVLQALLAENIGVGVHFRALPFHRHARETLGVSPEAFPVASDASCRLFSLPLHTVMSDGDQDDVVEALARIARFYAV